MSTLIHGIGASQNIDSSGECILMDGLDISSLDKDGVFNWEHKADQPSQIVGKILKAKKIYAEDECEDDHQLYFWNKVKVPYLYVMGELFDDYKDSAREVAGLFKYDVDRKGQNERTVANFSVEGAKIHKEGMNIARSIARKITITALPCNKAAIAEMMVVPTAKQDDVNSLFKTENVEIEIFQNKNDGKFLEMLQKVKKDETAISYGAFNALSGAGPTSPSLSASEEEMKKNAPKLSIAKPSPLGTSIGLTTSGKDIWSHGKVGQYHDFSEADHREASAAHQKAAQSAKEIKIGTHHFEKFKLHHARANSMAQAAKNTTVTPKMIASKPSMKNKQLHDPQLSGKVDYKMNKAMTAGSGIASPDKLEGSAALSKKPAKSTYNASRPSNGYGAIIHKPGKIKKSQKLERAEEEYAKWEKREEFESFMKSRMPHLTKTEIKVLGQTMLLHKALKMESSLAKLAPSEFQHSYIVKKEKK